MRTKTTAGTALLATALLVAASYAGTPSVSGPAVWLVAAVGVLVFAAGWPRLLDLPAPWALSGVIGVSGLAAATLAASTPMPQPMFWMASCAAVGTLGIFMVQLLRGTGERKRLESTLGGMAGVLVAVLGSGWVAADRLAPNASNSSLMLLSGLGLAAAVLVSSIRWPDRITGPLALVVAALVAGTASILVADVGLWPAVVVGAVAGVVVAGARALVVSEGGPSTTTGAIATGLLPVLASGAPLYFVERLVLR
ncbi:hypothetical protein ACQ3I4_10345 [Zafaria sp. Z1313]|uniref:hypothetical protein n=1 Tax=unclassified Zafaria TaxID=2828765 RepID=UPI002E7A3997|nr:hypothetical protein [Zafaria sp. J156]MEE1620596.1 hypothetical protein [Zafaria sp. J156]